MIKQIELKPVVGQEEINQMCRLAEYIWKEHYSKILSSEQIEYMLEKYQSPAAISQQLESGYQYYWLCLNGQWAGFAGIQAKDGSLFLSKLYIEKDFRGQGIAAYAISSLKSRCKEEGLKKLWLTVNRHNCDSITAYLKMGFRKTKEQVTDIGNGYVMDDYIMTMPIQ